MPLLWPRRKALLLELGKVYDKLNEEHRRELKNIGNAIPVGGAPMDGFFRSEGVYGVIEALRQGKTLQYAITHGQGAITFAVKIWNRRREYQVHRWEQTSYDWLEGLVRGLYDSVDRGNQ